MLSFQNSQEINTSISNIRYQNGIEDSSDKSETSINAVKINGNENQAHKEESGGGVNATQRLGNIHSTKEGSDFSAEGKELCFFNCFRKLFSSRKKPVKSAMPDENDKAICKSAVETFSALINDKNLTSLVGKEFTLNTCVSVQSIGQGQGSEPNLIIQGSIPFMVDTPDGPKKKKVRVNGRLYNPTGLGSAPSNEQPRGNSLSLVRVNSNFKTNSCFAEEIKWWEVEKYTLEQYQKMFLGSCDSTTPCKLGGELDCCTTGPQNVLDIPLKSITVTRVRVKQVKYDDGSQYKQTCGKQKFTLKMPGGVYMKRPSITTENSDSSYRGTENPDGRVGKIPSNTARRVGSRKEISSRSRRVYKPKKMEKYFQKKLTFDDNAFTQDAYFCVKPYGFPYFTSFTEKFPHFYNKDKRQCPFGISVDLLRKVIDEQLSSKNYCPPPAQGYCPITWLYNSFDKTKAFVQAFSVNQKS